MNLYDNVTKGVAADYNSYVDEYDPFECSCGRGDGCDCDGMEAKAKADEEEGKREAAV